MPHKEMSGKSKAKGEQRGKRKSQDVESTTEKTAKTAREEEKRSTPRSTINNLSDDQILERLDSLFQSKDVEGLKSAKQELMEKVSSKASTDEIRRRFLKLVEKAIDYIVRLEFTTTKSNSPPGLGSLIKTLGLGSSAGSEDCRETVDAVVTSCAAEDDNGRGAMLSHFFYRSFLKHAHTPATSEAVVDDAPDAAAAQREIFKMKLSRIWKTTTVGVVRNANGTSGTPDPAVASLLAGFVNQLIPSVLGNDITAGWASEYPLHGNEQETDQTETVDPRTDGIFVAADPLNGNSLRALATLEIMLDCFDSNARYRSRSNACDAFAQQPPKWTPWPLLLFRFTRNNVEGDHVSALAFVPISPHKAMTVPLWEESGENALFSAVMATMLATKDFITKLRSDVKQMDFCSILGNIAIQEKEKILYKSFFNTGWRKPNIDLVRRFVDDEAELVDLGEKGSFIKMKWVGRMLPDSTECNLHRFIEIARELKRLHDTGNCHGDIRVSNLILGAAPARIIDFDFSGPTEEQKYPEEIISLVDGERHPEVKKAIRFRNVQTIVLKKEHDWHSLRAAMRCFAVKSDNDKEAWEDAIANIETLSSSSQTSVTDFTVVLKPELSATMQCGTGH